MNAKVDIKLFLPCPILLEFSIFFQIFWPGLKFLFYFNQEPLQNLIVKSNS